MQNVFESSLELPQNIKKLIANGADINTLDENGWTLLMHAAAKSKSAEVIKTLIGLGADVDKRAVYNLTALTVAAANNQSKAIIDELVIAGANVNARCIGNFTPLMLGVLSIETTKALLDARADVRIRNNKGRTALDIAKRENAPQEVINMLSKSMRTVTEPSNFSFSSMILSSHVGDLTRNVEGFLASCNDINARFTDEKTLLMLAIDGGDSSVKLVRKILKAGANINAKDIHGQTPLMHAVTTPHPSAAIITLLLDAGACVNIRDDYGNKALSLAYKLNVPQKIIDVLLKYGAK